MNELIYDRTESDVMQAEDIVTRLTEGTATETERTEWLSGTLRGAMNADDLNRIEQWTAYLAAQLRGYGYTVTVTPRETDWARGDFPYRSEVDRIRRNVEALQAGFYSLPDWREIVYNNTLHYEQANALEWDLQRIYDWMQAMMENFRFRHADTFFMESGGVFNA